MAFFGKSATVLNNARVLAHVPRPSWLPACSSHEVEFSAHSALEENAFSRFLRIYRLGAIGILPHIPSIGKPSLFCTISIRVPERALSIASRTADADVRSRQEHFLVVEIVDLIPGAI